MTFVNWPTRRDDRRRRKGCPFPTETSLPTSGRFSTVPDSRLRHRFLSLLPLSHMFEQTPFPPSAFSGGLDHLSADIETFGDHGGISAAKKFIVMIAVPRLLQLLKRSVERELEAKGLLGIFNSLATVARKFWIEARRRSFFRSSGNSAGI